MTDTEHSLPGLHQVEGMVLRSSSAVGAYRTAEAQEVVVADAARIEGALED